MKNKKEVVCASDGTVREAAALPVQCTDKPEAGELPAVLTVEETAALLRVDRKTIYEAIARKQLPGARRIGRVIRISKQAVLDWLKQDRVSHREGGSR